MTSPARIAQGIFQLPTNAFGTPALVNPGQEPGQIMPELDPDSGLPTKGTDDLMDALSELLGAQEQYAEADHFYDGEIGDLFSNPRVAQILAKSGLNDMEDLNYASVPVDTIAEKLQIRAVVAAAGDEANDTLEDAAEQDDGVLDGHGTQTQKTKKSITDRAQEWVAKLRKRNQLDAEEDQLHLRASKYGECYLFVWPVVQATEDDEEQAYEDAVPLEPSVGGRVVSVDMLVNSPYSTRAFYDTENPLKMTHVVKAWDWTDLNGEKRRRATLFYSDRVERWVTRVGGDAGRAEDWIPFVELDDQGEMVEEWPIPNPYDRIPFFHFRNDRIYGRPEHRNAYGPQRMINKLVVTHAATVDYQGFPQRFLLVDPKMDDIMMNLIDPDNPEDEDDDPEGEGRSQLRADPAVLWKLYGRSTGQYTAADPDTLLGPMDRYVKAMSELCGIPLSRFVGFSTPPSGESRRVESEVLYEKVDNRKKGYGASWSDAYEFALELLGINDVEVDIKWKPTATAIGTDDWGIVTQKIANGVPVKVALTEAGYPEDEVEQWLNDETGADLMRRVGLLVQIGTAVQSLGAGVGLGVVSAEQVGDIIARILGATGEALPDLDKPVELAPAQAMAAQQAQLAQRGQQVSEHIATAPPQEKLPDGSTKAPPPRDLPPMPAPPPPVKVGGSA